MSYPVSWVVLNSNRPDMRVFTALILLCVVVASLSADCKPKQELYNGKCVRRCQKGQERNSDGVCEKKCMENSTLKDGKCVCNDGFEKKSKKCVPACGENMKRRKGECVCVKGFVLKRKKCVPMDCPENEELRGAKCYCVKGTSRVDGVCTAPCGENRKMIDGKCECKKNFEEFKKECVEKCGLNSRRKFNGDCVCLLGYEEKADGTCRKIRCPKNEVLDGNKCYCKEGTSRIEGVCLKPCPENMKRVGKECECKKNYTTVGGECVKNCPKKQVLKGKRCVCDEAAGFYNNDGVCRKQKPVKPEPEKPEPPPPPPCPDNSVCDDQGTVTGCNSGFELVGGQCLTACNAYQNRVGTTCQCKYGQNGATCYTNPTDRCTWHNSCQDGSSYSKFNTDWRSCINACDRDGRCKGICWDTANQCWLLDPITTNKFYKWNGYVLYWKNCPMGYRY